ncbi:hypothetical protein D9758_000153 [Tetrapyrgos nigripes]|uniref:Chromatin-remodeling ATPase INO80 n=1 Tax=Tetrapyrgos nigripes TaxID=182062 RepID=A0A8H5H1R1_9AGAR|nr:hypothetical protein D9758_000153 [Tetrapyrgos nigripes]
MTMIKLIFTVTQGTMLKKRLQRAEQFDVQAALERKTNEAIKLAKEQGHAPSTTTSDPDQPDPSTEQAQEATPLDLDSDELNFQNPTSLTGITIGQPKLLMAELKEYQLKGLNWLATLYEQGINGILADEMGLGKTVQSISLLAYLAETHDIWGPFLVVAPASTLHNWQQEITRFVPALKALPYWGNPKDRATLRKFWMKKEISYNQDAPFHVLITSYQMVTQDQQYFQRVKWQYMILDEAQNIKNSASVRWKTLLGFHCRNRLLLTGTPIQNSMQELWALLHFIMPSLFDSHDEFNEWFSKDIENAAENKGGKLNEHQLRRLHMILKPFMLRRVKRHVQNELSEKIEIDIYVDLSARQRNLYKALLANVSVADLLEKAANIGDVDSARSLMNLVMQFRKVCNHPELFERADVVAPFSFSHFGRTNPLAREGDLVDLPNSSRNLIQFTVPELFYRNGGMLNVPAEDSTLPQHSSYLSKLMNIWSTDYIQKSIYEDQGLGSCSHFLKRRLTCVIASSFSFLRILDMSPQEAHSLHVAPLLRRTLLRAYAETKFIEEVPYLHSKRSLIMPPPLVGLDKADGLPKLLDISHSAWTGSCLSRPELKWYMPRVVAPAIPLYTTDRTFLDAQSQLVDAPLESLALYGMPSSLKDSEDAVRTYHDLLPGVSPDGLLGASSLDQIPLTNMQVPEAKRLVYDSAKLARLDALLQELKAGDHRVLIYFQMTRMMDLMEEYLVYRQYKYLRLDGSSKIEDRRDMVMDWQTSTRAGGLGINLTAADTVVFYDHDWNPSNDAQAMDRAHRLGQTRQVTVYRLITKGTIDERIVQLARVKKDVQDIVVGNKTFTDVTKPSELVQLLLNDEQLANLEPGSTSNVGKPGATQENVRDLWVEEGDDFFGQPGAASGSGATTAADTPDEGNTGRGKKKKAATRGRKGGNGKKRLENASPRRSKLDASFCRDLGPAGMAKKKKTQLKPVARGFATTSVPKKVVEAEEEVPVAATAGSGSIEQNGHGTPPTDKGVAPEVDNPPDPEEESLQSMMDKFQEKVEKEVVRTVKVCTRHACIAKILTTLLKAIEQDRRYTKTLLSLEVDTLLIQRIFDLVSISDLSEWNKKLDETEDKVMFKAAVTYGTLRRLGFSESRVEECLKAINGVELEEAYDWLYMTCPPDELAPTNVSEDANSRIPCTPGTPKFQTPQTPKTARTPAEYQATTEREHSSKKSFSFDVNAPEFVPSMAWKVPSEAVNGIGIFDASIVAKEPDSSADKVLDSDHGTSTDEDDPNAEYVRLKLKIADLTTHRRPGNIAPASRLRELQARLDTVQKNYFFDVDDAERMYQLAREQSDAAHLRARLKGEIAQAKPSPKQKRPAPIQTPPPKPATPDIDVFDEDEHTDSDGGVLGILEEMPTSETTAAGVTITVRDMALPKHWSGRTAKKLLAEAVEKMDRYAAITFSIISGGSRVKRASVSIRWGPKTDEWTMEDVACHDESQAEQYIATVALHALTFPPTDGFATANPGQFGSQTFFRLLPPVYRDLWNELSESRRIKDEIVNRGIWSKLRSIVGSKIESGGKSNTKNMKTINEKTESYQISSSPATTQLDEQLMSSFQARQSTSAYQDMLIQRNKLPIAQYRQEIIQTLEENQILVLSGETGCGKSTQVPAFILEDQLSRGKHCKVYCTEPRRISAISLAQRVSKELGETANAVGTSSSLVGYSIRLESNTTKNTRLAYVTNGIALRMLEGGTGQGGHGTAFDEITLQQVHERSIESDFLLIVLKSLLEQRPDLKVILMSATVDAMKISQYFGDCPTLHVPGRTFPVDVHYLEDAVEFTQWSISQDSPYARRLHDKFYKGKNRQDWSEELTAGDGDDEDDEVRAENVKLEKRYSSSTATTINLFDERLIPYDLIIRLLEKICFEDTSFASYSSAILIFMPGMGEIRRMNDMLTEHALFGTDEFKIYPLHSTLSSENQSAVFDVPPAGIRKIVIATNIAETGITIPDITCVIDSGKHREMRFDEKRQISRLVETFIARSNAAQRRGRAGRVQSGLCFHLFTKLRHDTLLADNPLPEMLRLSLADLSLRIKIMKVKLGSSIEDVLSRALDPPTSINIQRAISMLVEVRALTPTEEITPMGQLLSKLPTDVHLGKFLLTAALFKCLDPALTIAASLNSKSPFISPFGLEQEADRAKASFKMENSDFLTLHNAFLGWKRACNNTGFARKFCRQNFLSHQNLQQIEELRQQFLGYLIDSSFIHVDRSYIRELNRARYGRHRTRFVSVPQEYNTGSSNTALVNAALVAGLYPKVLAVDPLKPASSLGLVGPPTMRTISNNRATSFHPSSVNFGRKPTDLGANHLMYFTVMHSKKLYVWETGPVDDLTMLLLCGEADFKVKLILPLSIIKAANFFPSGKQMISNSVSLDRKIKFQLSPKASIALKVFRSQLQSLLAYQFRGRGRILTESQVLVNELAMTILGKVKIEAETAPLVITDLSG